MSQGHKVTAGDVLRIKCGKHLAKVEVIKGDAVIIKQGDRKIKVSKQKGAINGDA